MAITKARPLARSLRLWPIRNPFTSVRGAIVAGFGLLVLILALVVTGSALTIKGYQSNLESMQHHTETADLLQDAQIASGEAVLFLFAYVSTGNELAVPFAQSRADAAQANLEKVAANEAELGHTHVENIDQLVAQGAYEHDAQFQIIELMQAGKADEAATRMQSETPAYQSWILSLSEATKAEQEEVVTLKSAANRAGDRAFTLLIVSGIIGGIVGLGVAFLVARSILRPMSALESTATAVASGRLDARAVTNGPRELAHLGKTMNHMMDTIQVHTEEIEERNRQLLDARAEAATDQLTGLQNHRKFHERLRQEVEAAEADGGTVGLIMLDIDNFKWTNDSQGHQAGDRLLQDVARELVKAAGPWLPFRYGGDEFAVLMPGADADAATATAERIRNAIGTLATSSESQITVSLGLSLYPKDCASAEQLLYSADAAMYTAKGAGKNRVREWTDPSAESAPTAGG